MTMKNRWGGTAAVIILVLLAVFCVNAARWLVIDNPERSDAIVVLAGETDARPHIGLEMLDQDYAPVMLLDVPAEEKVYGWTAPDLAARWIQSLPEATRVSVCPIAGLSTKAEAHDAQVCLSKHPIRRVLLVTSDFHTRRALSTFRHELPQYSFSVAAAPGGQEFGIRWWQHREWAKTTLYEWMRLIWWETIDRWR